MLRNDNIHGVNSISVTENDEKSVMLCRLDQCKNLNNLK